MYACSRPLTNARGFPLGASELDWPDVAALPGFLGLLVQYTAQKSTYPFIAYLKSQSVSSLTDSAYTASFIVSVRIQSRRSKKRWTRRALRPLRESPVHRLRRPGLAACLKDQYLGLDCRTSRICGMPFWAILAKWNGPCARA